MDEMQKQLAEDIMREWNCEWCVWETENKEVFKRKPREMCSCKVKPKKETESLLDVISRPRGKLLSLIRIMMQEVFPERICEGNSKCFQGQKCNNVPPKMFGDTLT